MFLSSGIHRQTSLYLELLLCLVYSLQSETKNPKQLNPTQETHCQTRAPRRSRSLRPKHDTQRLRSTPRFRDLETSFTSILLCVCLERFHETSDPEHTTNPTRTCSSTAFNLHKFGSLPKKVLTNHVKERPHEPKVLKPSQTQNILHTDTSPQDTLPPRHEPPPELPNLP